MSDFNTLKDQGEKMLREAKTLDGGKKKRYIDNDMRKHFTSLAKLRNDYKDKKHTDGCTEAERKNRINIINQIIDQYDLLKDPKKASIKEPTRSAAKEEEKTPAKKAGTAGTSRARQYQPLKQDLEGQYSDDGGDGQEEEKEELSREEMELRFKARENKYDQRMEALLTDAQKLKLG